MLTVGITGGIGSGKSFVAQVIHSLGYPVFHADTQARIISDTDPNAVEAIRLLFGDEIYNEYGLDRKRVASMVFTNPNLLQSLSAIVHPLVAKQFMQWVELHSRSPLVFKETAILFESKLDGMVAKVIAVTAPVNLRISRVIARDGATQEQVLDRMRNQLPDHELVRKADFVITNDGKQLILPQVIDTIDRLKALTGSL